VTDQKPIGRIFTATLVIGVSGAGKTSLLATFASYLWETFGKVLVLYSWDGGAIPTEIQKKMRQGLIRFWRCRTRSATGLALETLYFATKGYLPRQIDHYALRAVLPRRPSAQVGAGGVTHRPDLLPRLQNDGVARGDASRRVGRADQGV
jgi:ABC-type branched-subunit amino acid transport system ATPase component